MRNIIHRLTKAALLAAPVALALAVGWGARPAYAAKTYPAGAVINVTNWSTDPAKNAKRNGSSDDSYAIQQCITANLGSKKVIYFPRGTYLVSKQLEWRESNGTWHSGLTLQGEDEATTIIKLKDNTPDYGTGQPPRAVIYTASQEGGPFDPVTGAGYNAFNNHIFDLTVDTGRGNPSANGINYMANNNGELSGVTIRSGDGQGLSGLVINRYPGPCLIRNVNIRGFDHGIYADSSSIEYSITIEHLTLSGQRVAGIRNRSKAMSIRDLNSTNSVPAIRNYGQYSHVTFVKGNLTGGSSGVCAIENQESGAMFIRGVTTSGYRSALLDRGVVRPGANIVDPEEHVNDGVKSLFPTPLKSGNLPIEETPIYFDNNHANWANVRSYKQSSDPDDTLSIQRAIDSGKSTIYFPNGNYRIGNTIYVRRNVRSMLGLGSAFWLTSAFDNASAPKTVFRVEVANSIEFELCRMGAESDYYGVPIRRPGARWIEHATGASLTLRNSVFAFSEHFESYRANSNAGNLYLQDVGGRYFVLRPGQKVWGRQVNPETNVPVKIRNNGATLWILGLKTEGNGVVIDTYNNGKTEVLGAMLYPLSSQGTTPAFINNNSSVSLTFATYDYHTPPRNYDVLVRETRGTETRDYRGLSNRARISLFVGYPGATSSARTAASAPSSSIIPTSTPTPARHVGGGVDLKINFAPDGSQVPEGYISDVGQAFGERDNGHAYGWMNTSQRKPTDPRRFLFERSSQRSPDRRHDTLAQLPGRAMIAWELKLDNGTYRIRAVLGDPNSDARLGLKLEGSPASLLPSMVGARWAEVEATVEVKDGLGNPAIHQGGANYAFLDGHVKWYPYSQPADYDAAMGTLSNELLVDDQPIGTKREGLSYRGLLIGDETT